MILFLFFGCSTSFFRPSGSIESSVGEKGSKVIAIGKIESRDNRFNAHLVKNLQDFLTYYLLGEGFGVIEYPTEGEIQSVNSDYLLGGSVGNTDSGTLLHSEMNSVLFVKLYDTAGNIKVIVQFTVRDRSLNETPFLRDTAKNIVKEIKKRLK